MKIHQTVVNNPILRRILESTMEERRQKPELQRTLQKLFGLADADFAYHASDLYVVYSDDVLEFLDEQDILYSGFISQAGSGWNGAGQYCLDVAFRGYWPPIQ